MNITIEYYLVVPGVRGLLVSVVLIPLVNISRVGHVVHGNTIASCKKMVNQSVRVKVLAQVCVQVRAQDQVHDLDRTLPMTKNWAAVLCSAREGDF